MTTCQSATILNEMADRIGSTNRTGTGALLPDDSVQYLQLIDGADKANNAPNFIDANAWQILCKMRRSKIENEFRVITFCDIVNLTNLHSRLKQCGGGCVCFGVQLQLRSCGAQIAETEASQIAFGKRIASKKSKLNQCDAKIDALREQKVLFIQSRYTIEWQSGATKQRQQHSRERCARVHIALRLKSLSDHHLNVSVFVSFFNCFQTKNAIDLRKTQIYMKRGNVEMPLTGRMSDFENAILLDKLTLVKTNSLIQVYTHPAHGAYHI